jgi:hypothetical protein
MILNNNRDTLLHHLKKKAGGRALHARKISSTANPKPTQSLRR